MLVDTSVWIDHFRRGHADLQTRLIEGDVSSHPFVIGELACGTLKRRREVLTLLATLPQVPVAKHNEVLAFVETHDLTGSGIGWVDAHLLASTSLAGETLWTLDKRLQTAARSLRICFEP